MGLNDSKTQKKLTTYIEQVANSPVEVSVLGLLSGGAIQENWAVDADVEKGEWAGTHQLVLRQDSATQVDASHGRADEFNLLKVANAGGVKVPTPCFLCEDEVVLGRPFFLMHRLPGETAGHKLTKGNAQPQLVAALGRNLARIHKILPQTPGLEFLGHVPENPAKASVQTYRAYLDGIGAQQPAIEFGLAWWENNAPQSLRTTLCHRDYRTGNLMIEDGSLSGVLDWEFAGWNDPMEDIGWFMAKCWRFGADHKEAGGLGDRQDFYTAYEQESGTKIDPANVYYWEVMAHVRWASIACQQAARHTSGKDYSLELALTAYVVPELEYEILKMTGGH